MRQLTVTGPDTLEWLDVPTPKLSSGKAALVHPIAVGVCDFDRAVVAGNYPALPYPIAIGHEIVAEVIEIGDEVQQIKVGMQIVLPLHISCGSCPNCFAGSTNSCSTRPPLSNYGLGARGGDWGGAMSDVLLVPFADAMAVPLPAGLTPVDCAALGCNLVDLHRTIAPHLSRWPEPRLLIVGGHAHNMALYGVVMAKALGVQKIDFLDDDASRLADAAKLGAKPLPLADAKPAGHYQIVIDCSADPLRLALALSMAGPDGVCTPVWPYTGSYQLPVGAMFLRNVSLITGQPHARANMEPVLKLMTTHRFGSTSIPHEVHLWESADKNFGRGSVKRIFVRQ